MIKYCTNWRQLVTGGMAVTLFLWWQFLLSTTMIGANMNINSWHPSDWQLEISVMSCQSCWGINEQNKRIADIGELFPHRIDFITVSEGNDDHRPIVVRSRSMMNELSWVIQGYPGWTIKRYSRISLNVFRPFDIISGTWWSDGWWTDDEWMINAWWVDDRYMDDTCMMNGWWMDDDGDPPNKVPVTCLPSKGKKPGLCGRTCTSWSVESARWTRKCMNTS